MHGYHAFHKKHVKAFSPFPAGCGTANPGIWKSDPDDAVLGLSSIKPQAVRDPTKSTKFLKACIASSFSSLSILQQIEDIDNTDP